MACRCEKPVDFSKSNFSYTVPFTEFANLGVLAHQLKPGEEAQWDSRNLRVTDRPELNPFRQQNLPRGLVLRSLSPGGPDSATRFSLGRTPGQSELPALRADHA